MNPFCRHAAQDYFINLFANLIRLILDCTKVAAKMNMRMADLSDAATLVKGSSSDQGEEMQDSVTTTLGKLSDPHKLPCNVLT